MPKKRCLDAGPGPDVRARLSAILAYIQRLRANLYPADWTADPLYRIEQEIANLLDDVKHG
jgi:hypothetical protein